MSAPSDESLMRYFDGEVEGDEAREIEAWLETSPRGRLLLLGYGRIGDAVRAIGEDLGTGGADVADAVMSRIGEPVKLEANAPVKPRGRLRRWTAAVPAIGLAVAAAAAVALYLRPPTVPSHTASATSVARVLSGNASSVIETAPPAAVAAVPEAGATIEAVDFGGIAGSIFMVPSDQSPDDTETPVVWLMDDAEPNEGRMTPL